LAIVHRPSVLFPNRRRLAPNNGRKDEQITDERKNEERRGKEEKEELKN
jgi:hypothetical protein